MRTNVCINPTIGSNLHAYELNQLDETERDTFEEHMLSCSFCLSETQAMNEVSTAMLSNREMLLNALREDGLTFDRIKRRLTSNRDSNLNRFWAWMRSGYGMPAWVGAAAAVILIVLLSRGPTGPSEYVDDLSFQLPPYQSGLTMRGGTQDEASRLFESAMQFYAEGDYALATQGIKRSLKLDSSQPDRWLYLGVSQYAMRDAKSAIKSLQQAEKAGQGLTKTMAQWYLAQSLLYEGKVDRARPLLESVVAQDSLYADDARSLLLRVHDRQQSR